MQQGHRAPRRFVRVVLPWIVWALGAGFFFTQYIARVAPSIMVHQLMGAFSVNAFSIGSISAFFYYAYVPMQLPVGMLIDRFGVRKLLLISALLAALGCVSFGMAPNAYLAQLGRLFLGFGSAFGFVSGIQLAAVWFAPKRFGFFATSTQALGMLGAVVGQMPIVILMQHIGWRGAIFFVAILFVVLAVMVFFFVRDKPSWEVPWKIAEHKERLPLLKSLLVVMKNKSSWTNALYLGMMYAPVAAFGELWGASFLARDYHLHMASAAAASSEIFIGWAIGAPIWGWLSDKIKARKPLMIFTALFSGIAMVILLYVRLPHDWLYTCLIAFGVFNSGGALAYAVSGEINKAHVRGTSVAFANTASVLFGMILQPAIGALLVAFWSGKIVKNIPYYSLHAYHWAMSVLVVCAALSVVFAFTVPETRCQQVGVK